LTRTAVGKECRFGEKRLDSGEEVDPDTVLVGVRGEILAKRSGDWVTIRESRNYHGKARPMRPHKESGDSTNAGVLLQLSFSRLLISAFSVVFSLDAVSRRVFGAQMPYRFDSPWFLISVRTSI
jgi:hypothetical protein